ncbi:3-ketoacyl-CoA synthase 11 [Selaginella moellendorffii]|nr:3-ketoacyl-CoA synthase 11 [Selaginella moellendorffii]|eukprot:XP_002992903.2 3-ketoacyl-CoA synthase 11 [Selaginella moellendorffii]
MGSGGTFSDDPAAAVPAKRRTASPSPPPPLHRSISLFLSRYVFTLHAAAQATLLLLVSAIASGHLDLSTIAHHRDAIAHDLLSIQAAVKSSKLLGITSVATIFSLGWIAALWLLLTRKKKRTGVYIVDFACYKPDDKLKCSAELSEWFAKRLGVYTEKTMEFFKKVYLKSGVGDESYAPPAMFHHPNADLSWKQARAEAELVIFGAVDELLAKTGIKSKDIGILVVNSSCFNPTPSLSSMIVNHYKMGTDIRSFNLGGMGCSAGIIAIDLAKDLLGMHPNTYALVVSTENITHNLYLGNNRPMLVTNCLFRVGGAAILLSNHPCHSPGGAAAGKYELLHTVRIHNGGDDKAYGCITQEADSDGVLGITLTKHIMVAAADALKKNLTKLGPLVLPIGEQLHFAANVIARSVFKLDRKPYIPDFKLAFDHFLLHAGGRAVVDELEKSLRLGEEKMEACRMTLHRFGNTSSSCVWYELAYLEAKGRVRYGDRLWQLGVGSGFKCNSAVWRAIRDIDRPKSMNPWLDCIDEYPLEVPTDMEDIPRREKLYFQTVDGLIVDTSTGQAYAKDGSLVTSDYRAPAPDHPSSAAGENHRDHPARENRVILSNGTNGVHHH